LIEFYFQSDPQKDHFFCRAKVLLGCLINFESRHLSGTASIAARKRAVAELMLALETAVSPINAARYRTLVYNTSICLWEIVRPFLRSDRGRQFASEFNQLMASLEKLDDGDLEWRIFLLSAAAFCADDEKNAKNATDYVEKAVSLMDQLLSALGLEEQKLLKVLIECKTEVDLAMNAFREIQDREELLKKPRKIDPDLPPDDEYYTRPIEYPPLQGLAAEGYDKVKEMLDEAQSRRGDVDTKMKDILHLKNLRNEQLIRLHCARIALNPQDGKRYSALPNIQQNFRLNFLVQVQCILSNAITDKEWEQTFLQMLKKLDEMPENEKRNETVLDICRTTWRLNQSSIARKYMEVARNNFKTALSQNLRIKMDICEAFNKLDMIDEVVKQATLQQSLTKSQVEGLKLNLRIDVIKVMERALTMSLAGIEDRYLIVEISSYLWNIMIPLLTKRTRVRLHSTIRSISTALETIALDYIPSLRALIHHELALCEEAADYAGLAVVEEMKAFDLDFGVVNSPTQIDSNLLDSNRLNDQFIIPYLRSLNLRVDIYGTPSDINSQSILWLQQAKESTSKAFIKEMVTKTAILLFEDLDNNGIDFLQTRDDSIDDVVDWGLAVMQKGTVNFRAVELFELEKLFSGHNEAQNSKFTYALQLRFQLLVSLAKLSHAVQEINIFQKACLYVMSLRWNPDDTFGPEFIDFQIEVCCLLAESFSFRILSNKPRLSPLQAQAQSKTYYSLGTNSQDMNTDLKKMKILAVKSLEKAFELSLLRKDIFSVQNVLIYYWNLHLHLFKDFSLLSASLVEVFDFAKVIIQAVDNVITFPHASICFEPKILLNLMNVYSYFAERQLNQPQIAFEIAVKGSNLSFPRLVNHSTEACYLKRQLFERASRLSILNAVNGVAGGGGKGGKASMSLEPLVSSDNAFLNVYSNLAIAELVDNDKIPREIVTAALEKAAKFLTSEVADMIQKEVTGEQNGTILKVKEHSEQRLEMSLECHSRISRLRIVYSDFVAAQDVAELGVALFNKTFSVKHGISEEDDFEETEGSATEESTTKIFRWVACCEQYLALAVISFFESNGSGTNRTGTLDPTLVSRLQFISLQHLQPGLSYAIKSGEADLVQNVLELSLLICKDLILHPDYNMNVFSIGTTAVDEIIQYLSQRKIRYHPRVYIVLKDLFLVLVKDLIVKADYDLALRLLQKAFDVIVDSGLQKDLWPSRVICMSKKGMAVLDGLQKLKERDPLLQASVLALFARSTKDINQKIATYQSVLELLEDRPERIDYILELCDVMNSYGFPRNEVKFFMREGLNICNEIEEGTFEEIKEWEEGDDEELRVDTALETSKKGKSTSKSKKEQSLTGGESTKQTSKVGGTIKTSSRGGSRSRAPSRSGNENESATLASHISQKTNLKIFEQSCRLCTMLAKIELKETEQMKYVLKAVYYVQKSFQHLLSHLQEEYKKNSFLVLSTEEKSRTPFEIYSVSYPDYLSLPTEVKDILPFASNPSLLSLIKEHSGLLPLDLPSFESLPSYNATVFYLFELISILLEKQLYDFGLLVSGFCKLLLLSTSNPTSDLATNDRTAPLLTLQLGCFHILHLKGMKSDSDVFTGTADFLFDENSKPVTPGLVIFGYLHSVREYYSQKTVIPFRISDLEINDLFIDKNGERAELTVNCSLFQIETSNQQFESLTSMDSLYYWVKSVSALIKLGQYSVCEQLLLVLLFQAREGKRSKLFSELVACYNQIGYLNGKNLELSSFTLSQRELLQTIGDSSLFLMHFKNLMDSSTSLSYFEETKTMLQLIIRTLSDMSVRKVVKSKQNINEHTKSTLFAGTSLKGVTSKTEVGSSTVLDKSKNEYSVMEIGVEYLVSLKHALIYYLHFLKKYYIFKMKSVINPTAQSSTSEKVDINEILNVVFEQFLDCEKLFNDNLGTDNDFSKDIMFTRGLIGFELIKFIHAFFSKNAKLENYHEWLKEKLIFSLVSMKQALDAQKLQCERYEQLDLFQKTLFASKLSSGMDAYQENSIHSFEFSDKRTVEKKQIKSPFLVKLGIFQMEYSKVMLYFAFLEKQYFTGACETKGGEEEVNVIGKYLQDTELEENQLVQSKESFDANYFTKIISHSYSSMGNLENHKSEVSAKLLFYISSLVKGMTKTENSMNSTEADTLFFRDSLLSIIKDNIDTSDDQLIELLCTGCALLIEYFYGTKEFAKAGTWLFILQSFQAKIMLKNLWLSSLTQRTELLNIFRRVKYFEAMNYPNLNCFKAYQSDQNVLKLTAPAFKRLSISADPNDIMNSVEPYYSQSLFCSLQLCPQRRFIYLCLGRKSASIPPSKDPKSPIPEAYNENKNYFFDKIELTEENRRLLQTILEQQKLWQLDVSKFISLNGDNYFDNDDMEPENPSVEKTVHQKVERALSERFKALVIDLETIFGSLVGKSSRGYKFISEFLTEKGAASGQWNLTLLVDVSLQILPWEALPFVEDFFHLKSNRDFSLHMVYHRSQTLSQAQAGPVNSSSVRYIVDSFQEDVDTKLNGKERKSLVNSWSAISRKVPGGNKWSKVRTQNGSLSFEDFVLSLDSAHTKTFTSLFTCTLGRFGTLLSPKDIAVLNLEKIQFFCCLDNSYNDASYRRQNSVDVLKNLQDIELENGLQMSALLSLAGVNSLLINFWSVPLISQQRFANNFWKAFSSKEKLFAAVSTIDKPLLNLDQPLTTSIQSSQSLKHWILYSRVLYGVPSLIYAE
jgi:hypothetical protein